MERGSPEPGHRPYPPHRTGEYRHRHKMVVKNTIEERILALQEKKARLAENVMEGQAVADHRISREELLELIK